MHKIGKLFGAMSDRCKQHFGAYEGFNNYLEANPNITYYDIIESYEKILLGEDSLSFGLDFEVKRAMYDVGRGVNGVLHFLEAKYVTKIQLVEIFADFLGIDISKQQIEEDDSVEIKVVGENGNEFMFKIDLKHSFDDIGEQLDKVAKIIADMREGVLLCQIEKNRGDS